MKVKLNLMTKIKKTIKDIIYISRITKVTKKKLRILLSVFLSNTTVFKYTNKCHLSRCVI